MLLTRFSKFTAKILSKTYLCKLPNYWLQWKELQKIMYAASDAYTKSGFDVAMQNMKDESEDVWAWLSNIHVESPARYAMDTNCKADLVVNNLSEVFNKMILDASLLEQCLKGLGQR
jgi:hypothetical protein